jgi:hypothetical protein
VSAPHVKPEEHSRHEVTMHVVAVVPTIVLHATPVAICARHVPAPLQKYASWQPASDVQLVVQPPDAVQRYPEHESGSRVPPGTLAQTPGLAARLQSWHVPQLGGLVVASDEPSQQTPSTQ